MFQSSPVPEDGCNLARRKEFRALQVVSILTRPGGRVQRDSDSPRRVADSSFNPHPSRRTGATTGSSLMRCRSSSFQSSPVPEDGCNPSPSKKLWPIWRFQSSPVPEDGCNATDWSSGTPRLVSILTRPGGRVQPERRNANAGEHIVSILTRPGGRVQRGQRCSRSREAAGFNPHPSRRTGATADPEGALEMLSQFQSSPVPEDGCNWRSCCGSASRRKVSILTRPGGRVQPPKRNAARASPEVSILTRPGGRVQHEDFCCVCPTSHCFNPHPSRRTGATRQASSPDSDGSVSILTRPGGRVQRGKLCRLTRMRAFQSSPVPEDGCNCRPPYAQDCPPLFQSSPVPEDGCNLEPTSRPHARRWFQSSPVPEDGCNDCKCPSHWC